MLNDHLHRMLAASIAREHGARAVRRRLPADVGELERLVLAAADGSPQAWTALVERFTGAVRAVARAHRLGAHDVDDVVQTTWLRLLENIGRLRDPGSVSAWLRTTASRESLHVIAAAGRERPSDEELLSDEPAPSPVDHLSLSERRQALAGALDALPARHRSLLKLLCLEPVLSYAQIARALDMPIGSIGPIRGRCLTRLRTDRRLTDAAAPE